MQNVFRFQMVVGSCGNIICPQFYEEGGIKKSKWLFHLVEGRAHNSSPCGYIPKEKNSRKTGGDVPPGKVKTVCSMQYAKMN